ncbi:hypothetical protein SAMN05444746_102444 [Variovorax sp. OK212]|nr:hypothetical protein SAMN05518853_102444 [Variovorax sp. OK202]SFC56543.1 hypothetical protein SAMN05444746_102444 [Variovorax sp. OK212]
MTESAKLGYPLPMACLQNASIIRTISKMVG